MTETPGTAPPDRKENDEKTGWSKFREFITSTAGLTTGIATIVTALATIIGVLHHDSSQAPPAPSHQAVKNTSARAADSTATAPDPASPSPAAASAAATSPAATGEARAQWGPGALLITNSGTSLSTVPPGSNQGVVGDVYSGGSGIYPFSGTMLVRWTSGGQPTAQQCRYLATTQGDPGQGVNVVPGSVVCAVTAEGPIAIIQVKSLDLANVTIETRTTVWDLPAS